LLDGTLEVEPLAHRTRRREELVGRQVEQHADIIPETG
jgi:hypothetical protein